MKTARLKALTCLLAGFWIIGATGCGHYASDVDLAAQEAALAQV